MSVAHLAPIGIFGGRRDIMREVSPGGAIYQAGTFNGSPVPLACGLATLDILENERVLERLQASGEQLRRGLEDIVEDMGLAYSVVGIASMFKVFFGYFGRHSSKHFGVLASFCVHCSGGAQNPKSRGLNQNQGANKSGVAQGKIKSNHRPVGPGDNINRLCDLEFIKRILERLTLVFD